MPEAITIHVDGRPLQVPDGTMLASALLDHGAFALRTSVTGEARGPVCGMGICYECRVTVDGAPYQRACLIPCRDGMEVRTR